jgi:hypothetical protein
MGSVPTVETTPLLAALGPSRDVLLDLCREQIDERILGAIAHADYGDRAVEHRRAIDALLQGQELARHSWVPVGVLELVRWHKPDKPDRRFGGVNALNRSEGHWACLLACTLLLRARTPSESDHDTLAQLIDSARFLGPRAERATLRLMAWHLEDQPKNRAQFFWFGLVYLSVRAEPSCPAAWLDATCRHLEDVEEHAFATALRSGGGSQAWLLRTEPIFDQTHGQWQSFATDVWHRAGRLEPIPQRLRDLCAGMQPQLRRASVDNR